MNRTFREIIVYNDDHVYPEYIVKAGVAKIDWTAGLVLAKKQTTFVILKTISRYLMYLFRTVMKSMTDCV